jgi:hypothetical protein
MVLRGRDHDGADALSAPAWPELRLAQWRDTKETLHRWTQIVGKVRLALTPHLNHWWEVPLYVTARGLTTSPIPYRGGAFEALFDFHAHELILEPSWAEPLTVSLGARSVADFYKEFMAGLKALGVEVKIRPVPVEIPGDTTPFTEDKTHASYDPEAVGRLWHLLLSADAALKRFRGGFIGKASPVHFFWGSFDLAVTRFSGRRAPPRPGVDAVTAEAYSHEVSSAGWWPGGGPVDDAAFYSYAAPEPAGFGMAHVEPAKAFYHEGLKEFLLPYEDMRRSPDPAAALSAFLDSTYAAAADLGGWDRAALERA